MPKVRAGKKQSELLAPGKPRGKSVRHLPDSKLDFSDVPQLSDAQLAKAKRVGRPRSKDPKQLIAIRLSPSLIYALRKLAKKRGKPYQTLMHELLEQAVKKAA